MIDAFPPVRLLAEGQCGFEIVFESIFSNYKLGLGFIFEGDFVSIWWFWGHFTVAGKGQSVASVQLPTNFAKICGFWADI